MGTEDRGGRREFDRHLSLSLSLSLSLPPSSSPFKSMTQAERKNVFYNELHAACIPLMSLQILSLGMGSYRTAAIATIYVLQAFDIYDAMHILVHSMSRTGL